MYLLGTGVEKNPEKARNLLERGSKLGNVFAKRLLATLLMRGGNSFTEKVRGALLFWGSMKDAIIVACTDPKGDRFR